MGLLGRATPGIFDDFIREKCEVNITLTAGANCCKMRGIICGTVRCGRALSVIDCRTKSECIIPVDKIAAICRVCPTGRGRLF